MKKRLFFIPFILISFSFSSCDVEDGDINDWIGEYSWLTNHVEHWYFSLGTKGKMSEDIFPREKVHLFIKDDKKWHFPDPKGPGKSGNIKCYKDYICFLDMAIDYHVYETFKFKHRKDSYGGDLVSYYVDESVDRHRDHYDYDIYDITFKLITKDI